MDIAIHRQEMPDPLPDGFTPDTTPRGFGFTSAAGATIGTISGTVDGTSANVLVSINTDSYSQKTIYLRYRVYGTDQNENVYPWQPDDPQVAMDRNEASFDLTGLEDKTYYEIEASMGSDFLSCAVTKAIGIIGITGRRATMLRLL